MKLKVESIQPYNGRILIKILNEVEEYEGTVELMPTGQEKSQIAEIIKLPLGYTVDGHFQESDKVIFNRHGGSVLNFDKYNRDAPEYRLIKEDDIFCKILE